jgi:hypothetical protein
MAPQSMHLAEVVDVEVQLNLPVLQREDKEAPATSEEEEVKGGEAPFPVFRASAELVVLRLVAAHQPPKVALVLEAPFPV